MGFFTKLFGTSGTIRFEGETVDGRAFAGKTSMECFGVSVTELELELKNALYVQYGHRIKHVKITGFLAD